MSLVISQMFMFSMSDALCNPPFSRSQNIGIICVYYDLDNYLFILIFIVFMVTQTSFIILVEVLGCPILVLFLTHCKIEPLDQN